MPGGFHPFHAGHYALYKSALEAFPQADVYVAATNDQSERPFPFSIKEKLAKLAGVQQGRFVQVKSPFQAKEITQNYDPNSDVLIFVRSEKDKNESPKPGGTKKDGSPAYFQPYTGKDLQPFSKHAYFAYLPTVTFGPGIQSATEIRNAWPNLDDRRKTAMVMSLYPATQKNPKLAQNVVQLLDVGMGGSENVTESYSNTTFQTERRRLNVPALIKAGALFVTYPHGEQGWETDNQEDWAYSLISLYNVMQGGWPSESKKYLKPASYKKAEQQINSSAPNLGSDKLVYDGKYNQILWSIKKLGIPDNIAFLDDGQQGVAEDESGMFSKVMSHETSPEAAKQIQQQGFKKSRTGIFFNVEGQNYSGGGYGGDVVMAKVSGPIDDILNLEDDNDLPDDLDDFADGEEIADYARSEGYWAWTDGVQFAVLDPRHIQVVKQGVAEGAPIVVMPRADRLKKAEPPKQRYMGDIVPPTKPLSTEKRGVKGRPGQRPMPTYESQDYLEEK